MQSQLVSSVCERYGTTGVLRSSTMNSMMKRVFDNLMFLNTEIDWSMYTIPMFEVTFSDFLLPIWKKE